MILFILPPPYSPVKQEFILVYQLDILYLEVT